MNARLKARCLGVMVAGIVALGVAGCGGGGAEMKSEITTTTTGQQLLDLKKALDGGAITQQEYDRERQKILQRQ